MHRQQQGWDGQQQEWHRLQQQQQVWWQPDRRLPLLLTRLLLELELQVRSVPLRSRWVSLCLANDVCMCAAAAGAVIFAFGGPHVTLCGLTCRVHSYFTVDVHASTGQPTSIQVHVSYMSTDAAST